MADSTDTSPPCDSDVNKMSLETIDVNSNIQSKTNGSDPDSVSGDVTLGDTNFSDISVLPNHTRNDQQELVPVTTATNSVDVGTEGEREPRDDVVKETPLVEKCGSDSIDGPLARLLQIGPFHKDHTYLYNMDHKNRGTFIIINNKRFNSDLNLGVRDGTDVDAINLHHTFTHLGFHSTHYKNLTCRQMMKVLKQESRKEHWDSDCFACAILSHGEDGVVYGVDGEISIEKLIAPFKGCTSLLGKPKLFFIQACRGIYLDPGELLPSDGHSKDTVDSTPPPQTQRIPVEADYLFAYSTVPGYLSWRNSAHGSWFIQALCGVIEDIGQSKDILQILTRTNHHVAYRYESKTGDENDIMNAKKQIPSIVSMLTKKLVFRKK